MTVEVATRGQRGSRSRRLTTKGKGEEAQPLTPQTPRGRDAPQNNKRSPKTARGSLFIPNVEEEATASPTVTLEFGRQVWGRVRRRMVEVPKEISWSRIVRVAIAYQANRDAFADVGESVPGRTGLRSGGLDGVDTQLVELLEYRSIWTFERLLVSRALLWCSRRRRAHATAIRARGALLESALACLRRTDLFNKWPQPMLEKLVCEGRKYVYYTNEVAMHQDEPPGGPLLLALTGRLDVLQRGSRKGLGDATRLQRLVAPVLVGGYSLLADEPRMGYIKAVVESDVIIFFKRNLMDLYSQLSVTVQRQVAEASLTKRRENMQYCFRMTSEQLSQVPIFRELPQRHLAGLVERLNPEVVPAGTRLCSQGDPAGSVLFVVRGEATIRTRNWDGEAVTRRSIGGETFGEALVWFREEWPFTVVAETVCEFWSLHRTQLHWLTRHQKMGEAIRKAVNEQQLKVLATSGGVPLRLVQRIPLFRRLLTEAQLKAMQPLFTPKVHSRGDVVCSKADEADRLVIISKGKVKVILDTDLPRVLSRCSFGYTCLVVHRWRHSMVAITSAVTWELPRESVVAFTQRIGVYSNLLRMVKLLLQPFIDPCSLPPPTEGYYRSIWRLQGRHAANPLETRFFKVVRIAQAVSRCIAILRRNRSARALRSPRSGIGNFRNPSSQEIIVTGTVDDEIQILGRTQSMVDFAMHPTSDAHMPVFQTARRRRSASPAPPAQGTPAAPLTPEPPSSPRLSKAQLRQIFLARHPGDEAGLEEDCDSPVNEAKPAEPPHKQASLRRAKDREGVVAPRGGESSLAVHILAELRCFLRSPAPPPAPKALPTRPRRQQTLERGSVLAHLGSLKRRALSHRPPHPAPAGPC